MWLMLHPLSITGQSVIKKNQRPLAFFLCSHFSYTPNPLFTMWLLNAKSRLFLRVINLINVSSTIIKCAICDSFIHKKIFGVFYFRNYWPICYEMIYVNQINMVAGPSQNAHDRRKTNIMPNHRRKRKRSAEISHRNFDFSFLNWKL